MNPMMCLTRVFVGFSTRRSYQPIFEEPDVVRKFATRTLHRIDNLEFDTYDGRIVAGTMIGSIVSIQCEGSEMTTDVIKREIVKLVRLAFRNSCCSSANQPCSDSPNAMHKSTTESCRQLLAIRL